MNMDYEDRIDYDAVRERAEIDMQRRKRLSRSIFFVVSLGMFILFQCIVWLGFVSQTTMPMDDNIMGALIMLTVGWAVGLFMHGMSALMDTGAMDRSMREQSIAREIAREVTRMAHEPARDKAKHSGRLAVSDDGELVEVEDDSPNHAQKHR